MADPRESNGEVAVGNSSSNVEDESSDNSNPKKRPLQDDDEDETKAQPPATITEEGEMPQKKFYRSRAHCNPLSHNDAFDYPLHPDKMDWTANHYPNLPKNTVPTVLDIGCGFGGLTIALAKLLPTEVILGMEIRAKVTEYVRLRIVACRKQYEQDDKTLHHYHNASVLRTNSMKYLPNYFRQASLNKMFFCFPDPHFKRKNHGRRIISERLLTEYAFFLKPTIGRLYCITDVQELHEWHVAKCDAHPLFQRLSDKELQDDPCVEAMQTTTEESQKVDRAGSHKYYAVYQRIPDKDAPPITADNFFS